MLLHFSKEFHAHLLSFKSFLSGISSLHADKISKLQEFLVQVCLVPNQRKICVNQSLDCFLLLSFSPTHHLDNFLEVKKSNHFSSQVQDLKSFHSQNPLISNQLRNLLRHSEYHLCQVRLNHE